MKGIRTQTWSFRNGPRDFPEATRWEVSKQGRLDIYEGSTLIIQIAPGAWNVVGWIEKWPEELTQSHGVDGGGGV